MNNEIAAQLNPKERSDLERQQAVEKLVFSPNKPDPELWRTIIPLLGDEPVSWIQQLEFRLLKRLPFALDFTLAALDLLDSTSPAIRSGAAGLVRQVVDRLVFEKNEAALKTVEENLLVPLIAKLKREDLAKEHGVWIELYKTLSFLSDASEVSQAMVELLPHGGDEGLFVFALYVQRKHPSNCLEPLVAGFENAQSDDTRLHVIRALTVSLTKGGERVGYDSTEPVMQGLIGGLKSKSENVRRESCAVLRSRAAIAAKQGHAIPLENEVWDALFALYGERLNNPYARDKDQANMAIAALPINQDRLLRLFELMHRVEDEMEKQSVVGLIGSFKTEESRSELLKLLRENFAGLRLEAQKITIASASKYLPDEEVEAEFDKLLEGKGLHSDILSQLGDKLFAPLPSLKNRLMKWLGLNEKTRRPLMEQFPLPMMHTKLIQAARKLAGDPEIHAKLVALEPLLMMNDAKVKLNDILKSTRAAS